MSTTITEPAFPAKAMSTRRIERWLQAHNPYPRGTFDYHDFRRRVWTDQANRFARLRDIALRFAVACVCFSALVQLVGFIFFGGAA